MAADGSDLRQVAAFYEVVLTEPRNETVFVNTDIEAGPTWSPDGQVLAFAVVEFERVPDEHEASLSDEVRHNVLYSVRTDGSNLTRLLDMPEVSTIQTFGWSPDGEIAISYSYRGNRISYTISPDGSDLVEEPYINLSRSPDGTKILFFLERSTYVANADGSNRRELTVGTPAASWSPDGSKIALLWHELEGPLGSNVLLSTVNHDGADHRAVVLVEPSRPVRELSAANPIKDGA